jgi:hypothetical protein
MSVIIGGSIWSRLCKVGSVGVKTGSQGDGRENKQERKNKQASKKEKTSKHMSVSIGGSIRSRLCKVGSVGVGKKTRSQGDGRENGQPG